MGIPPPGGSALNRTISAVRGSLLWGVAWHRPSAGTGGAQVGSFPSPRSSPWTQRLKGTRFQRGDVGELGRPGQGDSHTCHRRGQVSLTPCLNRPGLALGSCVVFPGGGAGLWPRHSCGGSSLPHAFASASAVPWGQ